jgi:DNA-binding MarR family transcriptional regulator
MDSEVCASADRLAAARAADAEVDPLRRLVEETAAFSHTFLRWIDAQAADGLTLPRLRLVERLHCHGPAMMRTLADELELSPRNMTALVDNLESEGLVARRPHPTDRRATMIELTAGGSEAAEFVLSPAMGAMSCLFTDLTPEQQAQFAEVMGILRDGMKRRSDQAAGPRAAAWAGGDDDADTEADAGAAQA